MPVVIFQRIVGYAMLITGKQSNTNLTLKILNGRRENKGQSMLQHVCISRMLSYLLSRGNNSALDKTQEMFYEMHADTHQSIKFYKAHYQQLYRHTLIHHPRDECGTKP